MNEMTPATPKFDLAELRTLAEAATPGDRMLVDENESTDYAPHWCVVNDAFLNPSSDDTSPPWLSLSVSTGTRADAAFIAAVNPATVLAMIRETEQLEATLDHVTEQTGFL